MLINQKVFIDVLKKMDLAVFDGVCYGYAMVLAQFICRDQEDDFFIFLKKLSAFESLEHLLTSLNDLESLSYFLKEIAYYQAPYFFNAIFNDHLGQQEIELVSKKLSALSTAHSMTQIPMEIIYKRPCILSKEELIASLIEFENLIELGNLAHFAILLGNNFHIICIKFDMKEKKWLNRDINFIDKEDYLHSSYTACEFADNIFMSFFDNEDYTSFTLSIITSTEHSLQIKEAFHPFGKTLPSLEEQSKRVSSSKTNLLQLCATTHCTEELITILQNNLINPNLPDYNGDTPLHIACYHHQLADVEILLSHPLINPNLPNAKGRSPLDIACDLNNLKLVSLLLKHEKLDPNQWNSLRQTPLHTACHNENEEIVAQLLTHPLINPNLPNAKGKSPLDIACDLNNLKLVSLLLKHEKLDPNQGNSLRQTPLHTACLMGNEEIVAQLLTHPLVNPNLPDAKRSSPLDIACDLNNLKLVSLLLKHEKLDPNQWDSLNQTPLHAACINGNTELVAQLLAHTQIDPNAWDHQSLSPLDYASIHGHLPIVQALLAHPKTNSFVPSTDGLKPCDRARIGGFFEIRKLLLIHERKSQLAMTARPSFFPAKTPKEKAIYFRRKPPNQK